MGDAADPRQEAPAVAGWAADFPTFRRAVPAEVRAALERFVVDASPEQVAAWKDGIPRLQKEVGEAIDARPAEAAGSTVLEYEFVLDSRRADAVLLVRGPVLVVELKGKAISTQADRDQVAAYARDLRAYHRECEGRPVHAVLVPTGSKAGPVRDGDVWTTGPAALDGLLLDLSARGGSEPLALDRFLDVEAYRPLPTLVRAARELLESRRVRPVWRARARTDPAVERIAAIAEEAARERTRHLVLVTGVPGSGKTLVGLRAVHSEALDRLATPRSGAAPAAPALFLSGNGPLVTVLQYALRAAGGEGKTFVRAVKKYLDAYVPRPSKVPPEHVVVFDEAQRAFTAEKVRELHAKWPAGTARSEPQHFVDLAERVPDWSLIVGLVGTGQEIHVGEEGGIGQWREALDRSREPARWTVHAPADLETHFREGTFSTRWSPHLHLDTAIRHHLAGDYHRFVADLVDTGSSSAAAVAERLHRPLDGADAGLRLYVTRDLAAAKRYLHARYANEPDRRYGLLASSRDRALVDHGVDNSFGTTRRLQVGPWFFDGAESPHSCRHLSACATEFDAQGLELDMALVAWGSDFRRVSGRFSDADARGYRKGKVRPFDPLRLRTNAYRVLLTRGRDGTVVFVPPDPSMDETCDYLVSSGFRPLPRDP